MHPDELIAREQIRDAIARYAHFADGGRFAELTAPFAEDGSLEIAGRPPLQGRAAILAFLESVRRQPEPGTSPFIRHHVSSVRIDLLGADEAGLSLTETYASLPGASVSGLYFGHPASRYFAIGRIGRDQVEDYAARKGEELSVVERWLRPNLAYDPR